MQILKPFRSVAVVSLLAVAAFAPVPCGAQSQQNLDSTKADPQHHKVVIENDQVRVVHYLIMPGEKTARHSHPTCVNVLLTDANATVTTDDGKSTNFQGKAGTASWRPAITHIYQNIGNKPIEGMLVEPKSPHSARPAGSADETTLPGAVAKVEFENEQVRVVRYRLEPGQESTMHGHPDNVQIVLTDTKANITTPDGKVTPSEAKAGQVRWRPASQHAVQNTGKQPFSGILVEMKGAPIAANK